MLKILAAFSQKDLQTAVNIWSVLKESQYSLSDVQAMLEQKKLEFRLSLKMSKEKLAELTPEERELRKRLRRASWAASPSGRLKP